MAQAARVAQAAAPGPPARPGRLATPAPVVAARVAAPATAADAPAPPLHPKRPPGSGYRSRWSRSRFAAGHAAARTLHRLNPALASCYVSGAGTDSSERAAFDKSEPDTAIAPLLGQDRLFRADRDRRVPADICVFESIATCWRRRGNGRGRRPRRGPVRACGELLEGVGVGGGYDLEFPVRVAGRAPELEEDRAFLAAAGVPWNHPALAASRRAVLTSHSRNTPSLWPVRSWVSSSENDALDAGGAGSGTGA